MSNKKAIVCVFVLAVSGLVAACGSVAEDLEASSETDTGNQQQTTSSTETSEQESSTTSQEESQTVQVPSFEIVSTEDVSFVNAKRLVVRTVVPEGPYTEEGLAGVAVAIVSEFDDNDAISVFMYRSAAEVETGVATLATIDWAPNGNWEDAAEDAPQEYSFNFVDDLAERADNAPSEQDDAVYNRFVELQGELIDQGQDIDNAQTAELLQDELGLTSEEILEIVDRVFEQRNP